MVQKLRYFHCRCYGIVAGVVYEIVGKTVGSSTVPITKRTSLNARFSRTLAVRPDEHLSGIRGMTGIGTERFVGFHAFFSSFM